MRKLLAVLLAAVMLVTSLSCLTLMTVSADSVATVTPYTEDTFTAANADNAVIDLSANLLTGELTWYDCFENEKTAPSNAAATDLINGNYTTDDVQFSNLYYNSVMGKVYFKVLNGAKIDQLFITGRIREETRVTDFNIYAGNDPSTLFTDANKIVTYDAATEDEDKYIYVINLAEEIKADYIGMTVSTDSLFREANGAGHLYLREFGAYGTAPYTVTPYTEETFLAANTDNAVMDLSNNLLTGEMTWTNCFGTQANVPTYGDLAGLFNGSLISEGDYNAQLNNFSYSAQGNVYFPVQENVLIKKILFAGWSGQKVNAFNLYLGNDAATLFTDANKIVAYSATADTTNYVYTIEFADAVEAKYIGFTVAKSCLTEGKHLYLGEISVNGVKKANATGVTAFTDAELTNLLNIVPSTIDLSANLLTEQPTITFYNSTTCAGPTTGTMVDLSNGLYGDNETTAHNDKSGVSTKGVMFANLYYQYGEGTTNYRRVTFPVSKVNIIKQIFLAGSANHNVTDFDIYIGDNLDTLYSDTNKVASYVAADADINKNAYVINLEKSVSASYIGLVITNNRSLELYNAGYGNTGYLWLTEFGAYGTAPTVSDNLFDTANTITQYPFASPLNAGLQPVYTYHSGYKATNKYITTDGTTNVNYLTNCDYRPSATTYGHYQVYDALRKGYFDIAYDLKNTMAISSVVVSSGGPENTEGGYLTKWSVYVGDSLDTLYTTDNLCYTVDLGTKAVEAIGMVNQVTLPNAAEGRYVGIRCLDSNATTKSNGFTDLRLSEIAFFGEDTWTNDYTGTLTTAPGKNILTGLTGQFIHGLYPNAELFMAAEATNNSIGDTQVKMDNATVNHITRTGQGDYGTYKNIIKFGKIVYDLGENNSATAGAVLVQNNNNMQATYRAYIGDDKDTLFSPENLFAVNSSKNPSALSIVEAGHEKTGRYFGILVDGTFNAAGDVYHQLNVSEIAFYAPNVAATDDQLADLGNNLLDAEGLTTEATIENADLLTNNVIKSTFNNQKVTVAAGTKLTYDIGMALELENIVVSTVAPASYKVYYGNDAATLFNTPAFVTEPLGAGNPYMLTLDDGTTAQYVGFEFVEDATVIELGAYGKADLTALIGEDIDTVYVDGNNAGNSAVLDANIYKDNSAIVVKYSDNSTKVFLANGTTVTENEALANAFDFQGAQIRTNAPAGLRFVNTISADALAVATKVGTLAAKFADLNGADITAIDTTDYVIANAVVYDADTAIWMNGEEGIFSITLNNLQNYMSATCYSARPYLVVEDNGVTYTVYGDEKVVAPVDIAKAALEDENADLSAEALTYLDTIVNNANVMNTVYTYAESLGISDTMLKASVVNEDADYSRLARVIEKAENGEPIKLTALGGSVTYGAYSGGNQTVTCYANRFREYLANTFGVEVTLTNAGISATNSDVGLARFDTNVPADTDLLIVDYAVNDYSRGREDTETVQTVDTSYEAIIRKALDKDMAVILLFNVYNNGGTATNDQVVKTKIGNHYKLPMVSVLDAVWDGTAYREEIDGNPQTVLSNDNIHPNAFGHKLLSVLLSNTMAKAISAYNADNTLADATSYMPDDYLFADTAAKVNTVLYTTENLPEEWVETMGGYYAEGSQYNSLLPNAWRMDNTSTAPIKLNIPNATYVTLIIYRPHLSNDNNVINAQAPIHTFTVNGNSVSMYASQTDSFAVALNNFCSTTATDCEVTLSTTFKDGGVETARIIGFAVAQAE